MKVQDTKVFFEKIEEARDLRAKDINNIVVLVNSTEEGSSAILEGFNLALREYHWGKQEEDKKPSYRGFQFFTPSEEMAQKILALIPSHGIIPEKDKLRVTFGMMPGNVSLRWLAERIILEIVNR